MRVIHIKRRVVFIVVLVLLAAAVASFYDDSISAVQAFKESYEIDRAEKQPYKNYSVLNNTFRFVLPENWVVSETTFPGGEIQYHLFFRSNDSKLHGFIQVWDLKKPLKEFVEDAKKSAVGVIDFKCFRTREIMANRRRGYLLEYTRASDKGTYYKAYEAFIEGDNNRIYRASFYMDERNWKNYYYMIFNRIIQSFVINQ